MYNMAGEANPSMQDDLLSGPNRAAVHQPLLVVEEEQPARRALPEKETSLLAEETRHLQPSDVQHWPSCIAQYHIALRVA